MIKTYESMLEEIQNIFKRENLIEKLDQIYISFDDILVDSKISPDEELILKLYYNSYQGLFISFKLMEVGIDAKKYFERFAGIFEKLSKINNINLNSHELVFESAIAYYLSGNYVRAQVLAGDFNKFNLPNFKKYILNFLNKNFTVLREEILNRFNSDEFKEEIILNQLKSNEITEFDAFCKIFDFSILQSINYALNFVYSGDENFINLSLNLIDKYKVVSFEYNYIEYWWSFLVLELLIKKLFNNSLWFQLDSLDGGDTELVTRFIGNKLNSSVVELLDSQVNAIELISDENRTNFCINTPTSSGKTLIAELTILQFLIDTDCSQKVIYISPFRSLSHEIENKLKNSFKGFNLEISEFYGSFDSNAYESSFIDELDVLVLTPEKFDYILRMNPQIKNDIGLIIIDEGHIIGKSNERGLNFEFFVYRIQHYYEDCRFIFISGVLPNISDFSKLFSDGSNNVISSKWKPTDVYVGILEWKKGTADIKYLSKNGFKFKKVPKQLFYKHDDDLKFIKKDNFQLAFSALKLACDGLTFVHIRKKKEVETLANEIVNSSDVLFNQHNLSLDFDKNDLDIIEFKRMLVDEFGEESIYLDYLDLGFFIHYRDLPDYIKIKIEELVKSNKFKLIIGTSTLINGVNFPIKNILLKNMQMGRPFMDYHSFNNLCGRVGRAKIENEGRTFLYLSDLNKSNNQNNINHLETLINTEDSVNSIFEYLFKIFEDCGIGFKNIMSKNDFDEFNESLSKLKDKDKILIDNLDKQLLAFFEENKDYLVDDDLISEVVDKSLFSIQSKDKEYMENLLKARWHFIKKSYNSKECRKIYDCGLTLHDFNLIDSNKELLSDYVRRLNDWLKYDVEEHEDLLFKIGIFISKLKIGSDLSKKENFKLLLKYWIKNYKISEINEFLKEDHDIDMSEADIVSCINELKYVLPWGLTCILNYVFNYSEVVVLDICYNIVEMFKFGVFDFKISILMPIFRNVNLCEELSGFIDVNDSVQDILFKLERIDVQDISENNREKFINFKLTNKKELELFVIDNVDDFEVGDDDEYIIKKKDDEFLIYNLDGDYIFKCYDKDCFNIDYYDKVNDINKIWVVVGIEDGKIVLE